MYKDLDNMKDNYVKNPDLGEYRELAKNQDILHIILDSINDGILAVDNSGNIIHTNKRFKEMWKIPDELFETTDSNKLLNFVKDQLINPKEFISKVNHLYKSNEKRHDILEFKDGRIFDRFTQPLSIDGVIKGRLWNFKDITRFKKNEKQLKNKIAFQHKFINTIPNPVYIKDKKGMYIDCNMAYAKFLGISKDKILNKSVYDIFPEKLARKYSFMDRELFQNEGFQAYEYSMPHADGTLHDISINKATFTDAEGTIAGVVGVFTDITEKKLIEKALYESKERYRNLFHNSPYAILVHDKGTIIMTNETSAKLIGLSKSEELIGKSIMQFIHPDYHPDVENRIEQVQIYKKNAAIAEEKLIKIDGTTIDVEVLATCFIHNGYTMSQVIVKDITKRKQEEKLRKQAQSKLNEAIEHNKLTTEFFANISHEFKTPLNIILGSFQLLIMDLKQKQAKSHSKNSYKKIKIMQQNCYRLLRLVNNLIDITKIDSGYFKLNPNNYNIISLIQNITLSVADYIQDKNIKLIFDTNVEEKIVFFDPNAIERIMLNLLSNAVKFTDPGGVIQVTVQSKEGKIYISVKDNGIGIPESKKSIIFDRFRQVDKLLTRKREGSGIGLSLVKSFVEMHGGNVFVKSKHQVGTEFILEFPIIISEEASYRNNGNTEFCHEYFERINIEFSDIYS